MPILPSTLDTNLNNPTTFPTYGGKKKPMIKKRTRTRRNKPRKGKKTTKRYKKYNNNKYCARICKRNISMGYTIDKQKLQ